MTVAEALLVDTNILIEATDDRRQHHRLALDLMARHAKLVFPAQVIREYLVVATRPTAAGSNGLGMSLRDAVDNVRVFRERVRLLPEEKPLLPTLLKLLDTVPTQGRRIHDAHLVAAAIVHKVRRLLTLNGADFRPFATHVAPVTLTEALPG